MWAVRTPGEVLAAAGPHEAGKGVISLRGSLRACVLGRESRIKKDDNSGVEVISVVRPYRSCAAVAKVGSLVLGQVTALNRTLAEVAVLAVDGQVLPEPFKGAIRAQDVRETFSEDFDIADCFQPSDVVRAEVLSVDGRVYLLGTTGEEFGVLCGDSKRGGALQPVSSSLMRCSVSGLLERRKVARPPGV
ncbi:3'-5' exoribonuclease csl4, putative [Eimeria brunetti]|uniref:3'-5' exoribonuclease csl4, putative n=1 Tax=Eimeria brunetti TaxID=51314 RepID=U6LRK5_9EIME|nr:3'-5' exoribonuclease csl4, putative [Eimeria brunetti]